MTLGGFNKILHTINTHAWRTTTAALTDPSHSQQKLAEGPQLLRDKPATREVNTVLGTLFWAALLFRLHCEASHMLAC